MQKSILVIVIVLFNSVAFAQQKTCVITGTVLDEKGDAPMIGVNVVVKGTTDGAATDADGNFEIKTNPGLVILECTYLSYDKRTVPVLLGKDGDEKRVKIKMTETQKELDIVVVTGSKYEKKLSEETVSTEVLKGTSITQSNQRIDEALNKVPGVNMLGKSISIRGGSGFSAETGNRVLALLDELPFISPENGGIRWESLPTEALEQIEIIKGAGSALYGSSALNGVINMRTINPKEEPINRFRVNYGFYNQPSDRQLDWFWRTTDAKGKVHVSRPMFGSFNFLHAKKYGAFDVVFSTDYTQNQGYTQANDVKRVRGFLKLRYIPKKHQQLTVGLNSNLMYQEEHDFFLYANYNDTSSGSPHRTYDSLGYIPQGNSTFNPYNVSAIQASGNHTLIKSLSLNLDPYVTYYDKKENRHSIRTRFYNTISKGEAGDSSNSRQYYLEYTFLKKFKKIDLSLITGVNLSYVTVSSLTFAGDHNYKNLAYLLQAEKKFFKRWTIAGGMRLEYAKVDTYQTTVKVLKSTLPVVPVFRLGTNFQATEGTFIRASIGQGFRFPALAEKYVLTVRSGGLAVPNANLIPENSWSAEVGIKQGVKISKWMAYFDLAGYYTHYSNLIDYNTVTVDSTFPKYVQDYVKQRPFLIPIQAQNLYEARVAGVEVSAMAAGKIFSIPFNFLIGYTYMNARNLHPVKSDTLDKYLNFRFDHSFKADVGTQYKGVNFGITMVYMSYMRKIPGLYQAITSLSDFRSKHKNGDFVMDMRVGYSFKDKITAMFIVKNMLNRVYSLRPGFIEAPANYTFQLTYNL